MPRNQQGEGHIKRANKKNPVLSFRSPDPGFKARVQAEAERVGMSVQAYLLQAVTSYIATGKLTDHSIPPGSLKASLKATTAHIKTAIPKIEKDRLADILKDLEAE
jgi:hypothetical protein